MSAPTDGGRGEGGSPSVGSALGELLAGGRLDRDLVDRLATVDLEVLRRHMRDFLPDAEVDALVERVKALVQARGPGQSPSR